MDITQKVSDRRFSVINIVLDNGERLPCLVDADTWEPVRVATRWAVRYRRYHVQSSTLTNNLRILRRVYAWAADVSQFDLDDFLTAGNRLNTRQVESLAHYLRIKGRTVIAGIITPKNEDQQPESILDANAFNHCLGVAGEFFQWSLDSANRGGISNLTLEQLMAERAAIERAFRSHSIQARTSERIQPLEEHEIEAIRRMIAPKQTEPGTWEFPKKVFSPATRLRNWLMFETALELGLRRGELLKLRLDCLPRGGDDGIKILRHSDDPHDPRAKEPAVKTTERVIPVSRALLLAFRAYLTLPPPQGRVTGKSPYLFLTETGVPVSEDTANDVITKIGRYSGVIPLSWHRLRHTWAEKWAEIYAEQPNGLDKLMYLGGWTNPQSPKQYIKHTLAKQAIEMMRSRQENLY